MAVGSGVLLNLVLGVLIMMAPGVTIWMLVLVIWGAIRRIRQLWFHSTGKRAGIPARI